MTTYELPPEPPAGTRVTDKYGNTWERVHAPAPALPTENGALIIASGTGFEALFENLTLMRVGDYWCGLIPGAVSPTTIVQDQITSWTEAVAVPKDKLDALRDEVRSVVASAGADLDPDPYIARKARALVRAVEGEER